MTKKWVWVDLEMTGLDIDKHRIIEIASIITDDQLNILAEGPNDVIYQPESELEDLDPWVMKTHTESNLFDKVRLSKLSMSDAQARTLTFISQHVEPGAAPLCGNSIGTDRSFLRKQMPELEGYLHYRNIDVSSVKILYQSWCKGRKHFFKESRHRALDDIKDSINELAYYRKHFCVRQD